MAGKLTLENGKKYEPKDDDPVYCEMHNVTVRWGDLDAIQQLAVEEGIDIDGECILCKSSSRAALAREEVKLTPKDCEVLRAAANSRSDTFLPWRGAYGRAQRLAKYGYLKGAGASVMSPYVLYVITDEGRAALQEPHHAE